jgi:hypothetical protein
MGTGNGVWAAIRSILCTRRIASVAALLWVVDQTSGREVVDGGLPKQSGRRGRGACMAFLRPASRRLRRCRRRGGPVPGPGFGSFVAVENLKAS